MVSLDDADLRSLRKVLVRRPTPASHCPRAQRICICCSDTCSPLRAINLPCLAQGAHIPGQSCTGRRHPEWLCVPSSHARQRLYTSSPPDSIWHHHWLPLPLPPVGLLAEREPGWLRPAGPRSGLHPAHRLKGGTTGWCNTEAVLVATLDGMLGNTSSYGRTNNLLMRHDRKIWYGSSLSSGDSRSTLFSPSSSSEICSSR